MDVREKLVELLFKCAPKNIKTEFRGEKIAVIISQGNISDYLISHGVMVQERAKLYWKPVKPGEWNLTCSACDSHLGCKENASFCPECGAKFVYPKAVMPQPPKGE